VAVHSLIAWSPALVPRLADGVSLDWRVVSFASILSGATGFIFGLVPALNLSRIDLSTAFRDGTENRSIPPRQRRLLSALVVAEISFTLVLLAGSALMIRTFLTLRSAERGFDPKHVLAIDMTVAGKGFDNSRRLTGLLDSVQLRLQESTGVVGVAMARGLPREQNVGLPFSIGRRQLFAGGGAYHGVANFSGVSSGYFSILRMSLRGGREFTDLDGAGAPAVAIVNESMARRYWQGASPLGDEITIGSGTGPFVDQPRRIVGVVADVRDPESGIRATPAIYLPVAQLSDRMTAFSNRLYPLTWVVRTTVDPRLIASAIEQELRHASGGIPLARTRIMADVLAAAAARTEFTMLLFTSFAAIALSLAATGMYALTSYAVRQRSREIGIRMAFGASPADVRHGVVIDGGRLAFAGVAIGITAAVLFNRIMDAMIVGGLAREPAALLSVAALLTTVTLVAAWLPARRATSASALDALRG
jgi:predicted permease